MKHSEKTWLMSFAPFLCSLFKILKNYQLSNTTSLATQSSCVPTHLIPSPYWVRRDNVICVQFTCFSYDVQSRHWQSLHAVSGAAERWEGVTCWSHFGVRIKNLRPRTSQLCHSYPTTESIVGNQSVICIRPTLSPPGFSIILPWTKACREDIVSQSVKTKW